MLASLVDAPVHPGRVDDRAAIRVHLAAQNTPPYAFITADHR
ncbi:hypothetical protein [Embleya scabrispora]|nr:hypothetical protein [Embleya scabrispora]